MYEALKEPKTMVEHMPKGESNIAWFRLAEFVKRKEKERALCLYKLLAHSIADRAVSIQLQGDLYRAFDDTRAIDSYTQAVTLYQKSGREAQSTNLCEHVIRYLIHLKKYECIHLFITQVTGAEKDIVLLTMSSLISIILYAPQDKKLTQTKKCIETCIDIIAANHMISNESFWARLRILDEQIYQNLQQKILDIV
jgi:hypothetical protein